jgi:RNA polymerase sigma-70 factor, ECF subfamily
MANDRRFDRSSWYETFSTKKGLNSRMKRVRSEYTDTELFAFLRGEQAEWAFSELYARHSAMVYGYAVRALGDRDAAADIFQETFLRLLKVAAKEHDIANVKGYILIIARNLCINHKHRNPFNIESYDEELHFNEDHTNADSKELLDLIALAVEKLPFDMREPFILREYQGLPYAEVASIVGISMEAAKLRVFRARIKIREILEPYLNEL